jgi:hypothetical protein
MSLMFNYSGVEDQKLMARERETLGLEDQKLVAKGWKPPSVIIF